MTIRVTIDREACISCGVYWDVCPEVFEEDPDDQKSRIAAAYRAASDMAMGEVPEVLAACAQEAEDVCPVEIIDGESG